MAEITTIEEARAEILQLQDKVTELTNERDTLSQNNATLSADLESVRKLNQTYFNRLSAQISSGGQNDDEEEEVPTCEEFGRTLKIF